MSLALMLFAGFGLLVAGFGTAAGIYAFVARRGAEHMEVDDDQ